ncbi:MAG TPA: tetratricopeptide repeat protein [Anaerolineales bacterium]
MMASDNIIDVSEADFEYQVLAYSQHIPVVVDFWAEWCVPCRTLGPMLERLTLEAGGAFRLAKVNVDQNQNLSLRYNVRSIPAVKAFRDGKMVSEFVGMQPEPKLKEWLRALTPSSTDLLLEKGLSLISEGEWVSSQEAFQEILKVNPDSAPALFGLAKSILAQGQVGEAQRILQSLPPSREFARAEALLPLTKALIRQQNGENNHDQPLEAAYQRALRLILRGNIPASLDGLLDILREDKYFRDGEVRQVILGLFELMGDENPVTRQYRQELASVLF